MSWMLNQILDWFAGLLLDCLNGLISAITHALLITPDVTGLPQVQALTGRSIWVVDTVFILVFVAAGVLTMAAGGDERARYTAKDLLPRAVVGFIAAHFSQLLCGQAIGLANALTLGLTSNNLLDADAVTTMKMHLATQNHGSQLLFVIVLALVVFLLATTAFQSISRLVILLGLTAAAPIALACHALPQTDPVARLWWRAYTGCLAVPSLQAFTIYAGEWMLLDTRHLLPELPAAGDPGSFMNLLVVVVLLWTAVKIPGLMSRYVTAGGKSPNFLGMIVRVVLVQQISRSVPGLGRTVRAVTR
jgi:hypothetical protein